MVAIATAHLHSRFVSWLFLFTDSSSTGQRGQPRRPFSASQLLHGGGAVVIESSWWLGRARKRKRKKDGSWQLPCALWEKNSSCLFGTLGNLLSFASWLCQPYSFCNVSSTFYCACKYIDLMDVQFMSVMKWPLILQTLCWNKPVTPSPPIL